MDFLSVWIVAFMLGVLTKLSIEDWRTKRINTLLTCIFMLMGLIFFLKNWYMVLSLPEIVLVFGVTIGMWGVPVKFGFGLGDFLVFLGLFGVVGSYNNMIDFYKIFIPVFLVYTVIAIYKETRLNDIKNWKFYLKVKYPLVPAILIAFGLFLFIGIFP